RREIRAHRHSLVVAHPDEARLVAEARRVTEIPGAEEPHLRTGAARAVGFAAPQRGEDRVAGVLLGPHDRQAVGVAARREGGGGRYWLGSSVSEGSCSKAHCSSVVSTPEPYMRSKRHSDDPLCCVISTSGSQTARSAASLASCGSGNMSPALKFELWGIVRT